MRFLALTTATCLIAGSAAAADLALPKQLAWTAYGTGSAGYNQSVAIGAAPFSSFSALGAGSPLRRFDSCWTVSTT